MNSLLLARFARDAYLTAKDCREKVIEHVDAETDDGRAVITESEYAARCADSTFGAALELAGITDNEAALANGLCMYFDATIRLLIVTKPAAKRAEPKPVIEAKRVDRIALVEGDAKEGFEIIFENGVRYFWCPDWQGPVDESVHQGVDAAEFGRVAAEVAAVGRTEVLSTEEFIQYVKEPRRKIPAESIS